MNDHYTIKDMQEYASYQGGKCLSKEYWGIDKKLTWLCKKGHQWDAPFRDVQLGVWCKKCKHCEDSLANIYAIVAERGIVCLSTEYIRGNEKLQFQCAENHVWWATAENIKNGSGCRICGNIRSGLLRSDTLERFQEIAKQKGGKCLSTVYDAKNRKLEFECSEGHVWETDAGNIRTDRWCPKCSYIYRAKLHTESIETFQKIAEEKGGKCLSTQYKSSLDRLEFECKEGHKWSKAAVVVKGGFWCPVCRRKETISKKGVLIEIFHEIASQRGGKCLSTEYIDTGTKLLFECAEKHQWLATPSHIKHGEWCRICSFKKHTGREKVYSLEDYQRKAISKGGKCLSTEYINVHTKLRFQCAENHEWSVLPSGINQGRWCPKCGDKRTAEKNKGRIGRRDSIEIFKKIALEHGGECLSKEHINEQTKLLVRCAENHEWLIRASKMKSGQWCPVCSIKKQSENKILDIEVYRKIAAERGGKLLSETNPGGRNKLLWQCSKGHQWEAEPAWVKNSKSWCPICRGRNRTIADMQQLAAKRGGKCLSEKYINSTTKLEWQCGEGHTWKSTPNNILDNCWCPACSYKNRKKRNKKTAAT